MGTRHLLLDDALSIHEPLGAYAATKMAFAPAIGLRAQHFGELAVSAITATLLPTPLALFYVHGPSEFKEVSKHLFLLLVALAFFGPLVDLLHVGTRMGWQILFLLGVGEDRDEMVVMSITVWYVFLLNCVDGSTGRSLRPAR